MSWSVMICPCCTFIIFSLVLFLAWTQLVQMKFTCLDTSRSGCLGFVTWICCYVDVEQFVSFGKYYTILYLLSYAKELILTYNIQYAIDGSVMSHCRVAILLWFHFHYDPTIVQLITIVVRCFPFLYLIHRFSYFIQ